LSTEDILLADEILLSGRVGQIIPRKRFNFNLIVPISLQFGQVEFTSGKNTGFIATIGSHAAGSQTIELINAVPFSIAPNDTVIVKAGCNKSQGNCNAYENFINFGALPFPENNDSGYMPGNDELLAPSTR